jgi:hypothetical protein
VNRIVQNLAEPFSRHSRLLVLTVDTMTRPHPDLLPGTLDLLILRTLQKEPQHGWAISDRIQQISDNVLQINQGSLYPALIASHTRDGSQRSGRCRSSDGARNTTP